MPVTRAAARAARAAAAEYPGGPLPVELWCVAVAHVTRARDVAALAGVSRLLYHIVTRPENVRRLGLAWGRQDRTWPALLQYAGGIDAGTKYCWTPLHHAALRGHGATVAALLAAGAAVDARTKDGDQPLHWAARQGHDAVVARLLAAGGTGGTATRLPGT